MNFNLEQERRDSERLVELANRLGDRDVLRETVELGREKWNTLAKLLVMKGKR
jgi:predicted secreted protein